MKVTSFFICQAQNTLAEDERNNSLHLETETNQVFSNSSSSGSLISKLVIFNVL